MVVESGTEHTQDSLAESVSIDFASLSFEEMQVMRRQANLTGNYDLIEALMEQAESRDFQTYGGFALGCWNRLEDLKAEREVAERTSLEEQIY
jgi:hypothetical protein